MQHLSSSPYPGGKDIQTSSMRSPFECTFYINLIFFQSFRTTNESIILTVFIFTTEENISKQSTPYFWLNPFATRQPLYQSIDPSCLYLMVNTHFELIRWAPCGIVTASQVWFSRIAFISSSIAFVYVGLLFASSTHVGITQEESNKAFIIFIEFRVWDISAYWILDARPGSPSNNNRKVNICILYI